MPGAIRDGEVALAFCYVCWPMASSVLLRELCCVSRLALLAAAGGADATEEGPGALAATA